MDTNKKAVENSTAFLFRDPAGTRTQDPYIKSVLLYQLSYGIEPFLLKKGLRLFSLGVQK
jgi:hypothetical protein